MDQLNALQAANRVKLNDKASELLSKLDELETIGVTYFSNLSNALTQSYTQQQAQNEIDAIVLYIEELEKSFKEKMLHNLNEDVASTTEDALKAQLDDLHKKKNTILTLTNSVKR